VGQLIEDNPIRDPVLVRNATCLERCVADSAERSIRPLVLGRRNYLFAGSDAGGERAANIYTLIATARLNDIDPYWYLRQVLERIAEHPINRIEQLLPWNVAREASTERLQA
jgi:transposase